MAEKRSAPNNHNQENNRSEKRSKETGVTADADADAEEPYEPLSDEEAVHILQTNPIPLSEIQRMYRWLHHPSTDLYHILPSPTRHSRAPSSLFFYLFTLIGNTDEPYDAVNWSELVETLIIHHTDVNRPIHINGQDQSILALLFNSCQRIEFAQYLVGHGIDFTQPHHQLAFRAFIQLMTTTNLPYPFTHEGKEQADHYYRNAIQLVSFLLSHGAADVIEFSRQIHLCLDGLRIPRFHGISFYLCVEFCKHLRFPNLEHNGMPLARAIIQHPHLNVDEKTFLLYTSGMVLSVDGIDENSGFTDFATILLEIDWTDEQCIALCDRWKPNLTLFDVPNNERMRSQYYSLSMMDLIESYQIPFHRMIAEYNQINEEPAVQRAALESRRAELVSTLKYLFQHDVLEQLQGDNHLPAPKNIPIPRIYGMSPFGILLIHWSESVILHVGNQTPSVYTAPINAFRDYPIHIAAYLTSMSYLRIIYAHLEQIGMTDHMDVRNTRNENALSLIVQHMGFETNETSVKDCELCIQYLLNHACTVNAHCREHTILIDLLYQGKGRVQSITQIIGRIMNAVIHHPTNNINFYHRDNHRTPIYVALVRRYYSMVRRLAENRQVSITYRDVSSGLNVVTRLLFLMSDNHTDEVAALYRDIVLRSYVPGGKLYQSTDHEDPSTLTELYEFYFADPATIPAVLPDEATPAERIKWTIARYYNYGVNGASREQQSEMRRILLDALPEGDDLFMNEGKLFFPHSHPYQISQGLSGGITQDGIVQFTQHGEGVAHATNAVKKHGIPCYLGKECPSEKKTLSLSEMSILLPPEEWARWKPSLLPPVVLRGLNQTIGQRQYNAVLANHRRQDPSFGNLYGYSICPFCMELVNRIEGCSYMYHLPRATPDTIATTPYCRSDLCVNELYDLFRNTARTLLQEQAARRGEEYVEEAMLLIEFCIQCGAPTCAHQHIDMSGDRPRFRPIPRKPDGSRDYGTCPGGGRRELIARAMGAIQAYTQLPTRQRIPTEERREVAIAAWAAATDPDILTRADQYIRLMRPYEGLQEMKETMTQRLTELENELNALQHTEPRNEARERAVQAEREDFRRRMEQITQRIFAEERKLQFQMDPMNHVPTYNNNDYRRFNEERAQRAPVPAASAASANGNEKTQEGGARGRGRGRRRRYTRKRR